MDSIDSVEELVTILSQSQASDFVKISEKLNLNASDFEDFASWKKEGYTRNCIAKEDHYELLLLCWGPRQKTPIHCHNGEECWVLNLKGDIEEIRYDEKTPDSGELVEVSKERFSEGGLSYMNDDMGFHALENLNDSQAMTLHLYMDPIESCRIFDEEKQEFVRKKLAYDSVANLELKKV